MLKLQLNKFAVLEPKLQILGIHSKILAILRPLEIFFTKYLKNFETDCENFGEIYGISRVLKPILGCFHLRNLVKYSGSSVASQDFNRF